MTKKKLITAIAIAAVAIGIAAYVMWPRGSVTGKRVGATDTVCAACGHTEKKALSSVPDTCSECGAKQVYPAVKCPKCGTACPLKTAAGPQMHGAFVTCPHCGQRFSPHSAPATVGNTPRQPR